MKRERERNVLQEKKNRYGNDDSDNEHAIQVKRHKASAL